MSDWDPPYPIVIPLEGNERDISTDPLQSEIEMWTEVRDFFEASEPILTEADSGTKVSTDAENAIGVGSDGKPFIGQEQLQSVNFNGTFLPAWPAGDPEVTVPRAETPAIETSHQIRADTETFCSILIRGDASEGVMQNSALWPEKFQFWFQNDATVIPHRTGFFNEYGELRGIAALKSTVGFRVYGMETHFTDSGRWRNANVPIMEVCDDRSARSRLFGVMGVNATGTGRVVVNHGDPITAPNLTENFTVFGTSRLTGTVVVGGNVTIGAGTTTTVNDLNVTGTLTAPGFAGGGNKVTSMTGTTGPASPSAGDVWIQY
jgi:hypothetical protein